MVIMAIDIYEQFKDFKAFEVVFLDEENQPRKIFCTVKSIENDNIILDANNEKNDNLIAQIGTELKLHIYTENGIYSATSKVLSLTKGLMNTEYIISYPTNSKHSQRREYFRADMDIEFKMQITTNSEPKETFHIAAKTRNICGKGMSFVYDREFSAYSSAQIELLFREKSIRTSASLVYSKQIVMGSKPKYILAFNFNDISSKDIDFIVKKCFLYQLEVRKKHAEQLKI